MTAITLYPHEVRRLLEHGLALLVRPVKPQPPAEVNFTEPWKDGRWELSIDHFDGTGEMVGIATPPWTSGSLTWARETWAAIYPGVTPVPLAECTIEYRADTTNSLPGQWPDDERDDPMCPQWMSPVTMPRWASRFPRLLVGDVRCTRVGELSEADAALTGVVAWHGTVNGTVYKPEFSIEWVRRFGKIAPYMTAWAWVVEVSVEGGTP